MSNSRWRFALSVALLAALALGLRLGAVWLVHGSPTPTFEHGEIAKNLVAGNGFRVMFLGSAGPTSQQAPLYPAMLAACYALWGVGSNAAIVAMQIAGALAGTVLVLVIARLGWLLVPGDRAVGWGAGILAAVYPPHVYMVTHIQVAVWASLFLALWLMLLADPRRRRPRFAALVGFVAGVDLLFEPIHALALPVAMLALGSSPTKHDDASDLPKRAGRIGFARRWLRAHTLPATIMAVVCCAVLAPWTVRNRIVHGQWVFVKSTFGYAFWQGNNPHSWGTDKIPTPAARAKLSTARGERLVAQHRALWAARNETIYIDDAVLRPRGYERFAGLGEPARSALLLDEAMRFVRENPGAYARLCVQRLRYFLLFDETNPKASHPIYRASSVAWLVLASVGMLASFRQARRFWPSWSVVVLLTLFHTLVITSARFRLPVEAITLAWCSTAVSPLISRLARRFVAWRTRHILAPPPPGLEGAHGLRGPHRRLPAEQGARRALRGSRLRGER